VDDFPKNWLNMKTLGREIDILSNYPKAKRDLNARLESKSEESRKIGRKFGFDYFDGNRNHGYGGFSYNPKFWQPVIPTIVENYKISNSSNVLDVGCAKGFFLYDLKLAFPGINITGLDISDYAVENSIPEIKPYLQVGNATKLPFEDDCFDFVISINTIHNLNLQDCATALQEMERVTKGNSFITVDAYRNDEEKARMQAWNLTALTMMSVDEWKQFFLEVGYTGDYYWFIP
jgi:SAM-dependent methyltransferase